MNNAKNAMYTKDSFSCTVTETSYRFAGTKSAIASSSSCTLTATWRIRVPCTGDRSKRRALRARRSADHTTIHGSAEGVCWWIRTNVTSLTSRKTSRQHHTTAARTELALWWLITLDDPQYIGAVSTGGCGWLVSRALNTRLKSPAPQGVSTRLPQDTTFPLCLHSWSTSVGVLMVQVRINGEKYLDLYR